MRKRRNIEPMLNSMSNSSHVENGRDLNSGILIPESVLLIPLIGLRL